MGNDIIPTINGSCLCGAVKFHLSQGFGTNVMCWCNNCSKGTGSLFMANTFVEKKTIIMASKEQPTLRTYVDSETDSGGTVRRSFCSACGSSLFSENDKFPGGAIVAVGTLDCRAANVTWSPQTELFTKNKPQWLEIKYEQAPGKDKSAMDGFYKDDGTGLGDV